MKRKVDLSTTVRASAPAVVDLFWQHPASVFGDSGEAPKDDGWHFRSVLHVDGHHGSVRHDVLVHLGAGPDLGVWRLVLEPLGSSRILPSFRGSITVSDADDGTTLQLTGSYEVPFGPVGTFGDALVGHRLAIQSLQSFLEEAGTRLDERIDAAIPAGGRPAAYPLDLRRPEPAPETWLG